MDETTRSDKLITAEEGRPRRPQSDLGSWQAVTTSERPFPLPEFPLRVFHSLRPLRSPLLCGELAFLFLLVACLPLAAQAPSEAPAAAPPSAAELAYQQLYAAYLDARENGTQQQANQAYEKFRVAYERYLAGQPAAGSGVVGDGSGGGTGSVPGPTQGLPAQGGGSGGLPGGILGPESGSGGLPGGTNGPQGTGGGGTVGSISGGSGGLPGSTDRQIGPGSGSGPVTTGTVLGRVDPAAGSSGVPGDARRADGTPGAGLPGRVPGVAGVPGTFTGPTGLPLVAGPRSGGVDPLTGRVAGGASPAGTSGSSAAPVAGEPGGPAAAGSSTVPGSIERTAPASGAPAVPPPPGAAAPGNPPNEPR